MGESSRSAAAGQSPTAGMRIFGFVFLLCAAIPIARVATRSLGGDWRSDVLVAGLGITLLLIGLGLNGWLLPLCYGLAWIFPATLLFGAVVLLVDPGYGTFLDGPRVRSDAQHRGFGVVFLIAGAAGLAGYAYAVHRKLRSTPKRHGA